MKTEHQKLGERLTQLIRSPGAGTRMQSASTGSSVAGGNTGAAEFTTRATADLETETEWMMGDPWTSGFYFKPWRSDPED